MLFRSRIDLVNKTVTLCEKGGKWRTVHYDRGYQAFMRRLVNENPGGPIFTGLKQSTMYVQVKKVSHEAGFQGRGLHGMRKSFAVQRHRQYVRSIKELSEKKEWKTLAREFPVSIQKAHAICRRASEKTIDKLARLRLTRDLGHNRIEITYRYVPKEKKR